MSAKDTTTALVQRPQVRGVPAKPVRKMSQDELDDMARNAADYFRLWNTNWPR